MVKEIIAQGGYVDKFIGDAIMAVFRGDYHLDRAIDASLAIRKQINLQPAVSGFTPRINIGINCGEMISGNIGSVSLRRLDHTVIGDAVNIAQRLQSAAAPDQIVWMIFLGIALHGICYDFFFVTGFMYTDKVASKDIRGQARSMLVFFTQGVGMFVGYKIAFAKFAAQVTGHQALSDALTAAKPVQDLSFLQKTGKMFSVRMPDLDPALLSDAAAQWKTLWVLPCVMAAIIMVVFAAGFWPGKEGAQATPESKPA